MSREEARQAADLPVTTLKWCSVIIRNFLNKSYSLMDEDQIERIAEIISMKKRIYVYGKGSSGLAAMEMKLRFMRIGVTIEAITDVDIMKMNSVLLDSECAAIGISVSGRTEAVINSLKSAKKCGAAVILMTSHVEKRFQNFCDEIMLFAVKADLEEGKAISPQFPILVMVDMLYSRMLRMDYFRRETLHEYTLEVLEKGFLGILFCCFAAYEIRSDDLMYGFFPMAQVCVFCVHSSAPPKGSLLQMQFGRCAVQRC